MKDQNEEHMSAKDAEFQIAFGWLTALSATIASWVGLS